MGARSLCVFGEGRLAGRNAVVLKEILMMVMDYVVACKRLRH